MVRMWRDLAEQLLLVSLALPVLTLGAFGLAWLAGARITERVITRFSTAATALAAVFTWAGAGIGLANGLFPLEVGPFHWFAVADYAFDLTFRWDLVSLVMALGAATLSALTVGFSVHYLHREKGVVRYFMLMLLFSSAMQWLVVSGSYDQLFLGWELVGLTSILLVAYFGERAQPVIAAVRVMIVYRLCDLGLLVGAVVMHQAAHGTRFGQLEHAQLSPAVATTVALLMLLAASGKAAQLPFGTWLPRAMEGPTTSSAVFYGALSVHAGIYLLIRSEPIFEQSTLASVAAVLVGGVTATVGGLQARIQPDAKTSLAWASMSQLGLMVVEVGLHLPTVALVHLFGHASLRGFQMLKAPSLLHDSIALRKVLGVSSLAARTAPLPPLLYRVLRDGFFIDIVLERLFIAPVMLLGRLFERAESAWADRVARQQVARQEREKAPEVSR